MKRLISLILIVIMVISLFEFHTFAAASLPTASQIKSAYMSMSHPYITISSADVTAIKQKTSSDSWLSSQYSILINNADSLLSQSPVPYTHDGTHINTTAGSNASTLAIAYVFTGDTKYAAKAWVFAEAVCEYKDWNYAKQYLDTADIIASLGYVYDALYNYLNSSQKQKLLTAIRRKGLDEALGFYDGTTDSKSLYWSTNPNNWNIVCNGGVITGAAAIFDSDPDYCANIISEAIASLEYAMPTYLPDGGFEEGSSYWAYASAYLVCALDALRTGFGTDFGISEKYSLGTTASFPLYMDSDGGTFSVGDAYLYQQLTSSAYYFAIQDNNTALASIIVEKMKEYQKNGNLIFLKHYQPSLTYDTEPPLDASFQKPASVTFRRTWDKGGNYVAFHGGSNSLGHGDLDIGTFVFDAGGKRFVTDLGRDDYYYPGYWDMSQRYTYYAKRGEGNNVLLINPVGKHYDQQYYANSSITRFESADLGGLGVLNTAEAYGTDVKSAQRGFKLSDNRRMLSIRDEVELKNDNNDIYWFAHTTSDIKINGDGKSATMTIGSTKVNITLECSEEDAVFSVMEPVHMSPATKPADKYITNYQGNYKKLTVHTNADKGPFYLAINMAPDTDDYDKDRLTVFEPISDWTVSDITKSDASYAVTSAHKGTSVSVDDRIFRFTYPGTSIADADKLSSGIKVYAGTNVLTYGTDYKFLPVGSQIGIKFEHPLMPGCRYKIMANALYNINGTKLASHTFSFSTQSSSVETLEISKGIVECNKNILTITPSVYLSKNTTASVSCFVDGNLSYTIDQPPYKCELTGLSVGTHEIRLVISAFGKTAECRFNYNITDEYAINIAQIPADGSKLLYAENIELRAEVSDSDYVQFYIDDELKASFTNPPYTYVLSSLAPGTHTFKITASNAFGSDTQTTTFDVEGKYRNEGKKTIMTFDNLSPGDEISLASGVSYNLGAASEAVLIDGGEYHKTALSFESYNSANYTAGFNDWSGYWYDAVKVNYDIMLSGNLSRRVHFTNFNGNYIDLYIQDGIIRNNAGTVYGTVEADRWYSVEIIADAIRKCAYLYIDGNLIYSQKDISSFGATFRNLNTYFTTGVKNSSITYDNYSLSNLCIQADIKTLKVNSEDTESQTPVITSEDDKIQILFYNAVSQSSLDGKVFWTDGTNREDASFTLSETKTVAKELCAYKLEISAPKTLAGKIWLVFEKGIVAYPQNKTSPDSSDASTLPQNIKIAFDAKFPVPVVECSIPDGTEFLYADNIEFEAWTEDATGAEFYIDDKAVASFDSSHCVYTASGLTPGEHTLRIVAHGSKKNTTKTVRFTVNPIYRNFGKWVNMNFDGQKPGDEVSLVSGLSLYGMSTCRAELADGGAKRGTALRFVTTGGANYISGFNDWTGYWHDAVKIEYDIMLSNSIGRNVMFPAFAMSGGTAGCGVSIKNGVITDGDGKEYGTIETERWYKIEIIADSVEQTYSLYIDHQLIHKQTNIAVFGSFLRNFNTYFTTGAVDSSIYFDNYGVTYLLKSPAIKSASVNQTPATDDNVKVNFETDKINIEFYNAVVLDTIRDRLYWTDGTDTEPASYTYKNTITHNNLTAAYNFEIDPPKNLMGDVKLVFEEGIKCYPKNKSSIYASEYGISFEDIELMFYISGIKITSQAELIYGDDGICASAVIYNNTDSQYDIYAVLAAYSGNKLTEVSVVPYRLSAGEEKTLVTEGLSLGNADTLKCYIWTTNLKPLYMKAIDNF